MIVNTDFAKLENGKITYATNPLHHDAGFICTNDPAVLKSYGYLPIHRTPVPQPVSGHVWVPSISVVDDTIDESWTLVEVVPDPDDPVNIIDIMEGVVE